MGFEWSGHGDKVRWSIYFTVSDVPICLELAKFGMRIWHPKEDQPNKKRIIGQLQSALRRLEEHLMPLIDASINDGEVTVANHSSEFRDRYEFFREKAGLSYAEAAAVEAKKEESIGARKKKSDEIGTITALLGGFGEVMRNRREGFYYSVSMIDAYFSYLEHRTTLLRAFIGKPIDKGNFKTILGAKWDDKLRMIAPSPTSREFQTLLGRLRELKERIRNPFAHGGVENDGGSIFCHIPNVGAIPGNLSRIKNSARFRFIPVDTEDHTSVCELFDDVDSFLSKDQLAIPCALAEGGVHPAWDNHNLSEYAKLNSSTMQEVTEFIMHWNRLQDMHENMDY